MLGSAWLLPGRMRNPLNSDQPLRAFGYPVGDARENRR